MFSRNDLLRLAAAIAVVLPLTASAGFEIVQDERPAEETAKSAPKAKRTTLAKTTTTAVRKDRAVLIGGINHSGRKPAILPKAKGFGKNVTLRDALTMIVPANYEIYNDGDVDLDTIVSWAGTDGEDWSTVLSSLLRKHRIVSTMDWNKRSLTLDKQVGGAAAASRNFVLAVSDRSVKRAFERWSKESGWRVDWDVAVDFPVTFDVEFNGPFENAVSEVIASLTGSDYPIQACAYENNTLRVVRYGEQQRCHISTGGLSN